MYLLNEKMHNSSKTMSHLGENFIYLFEIDKFPKKINPDV